MNLLVVFEKKVRNNYYDSIKIRWKDQPFFLDYVSSFERIY